MKKILVVDNTIDKPHGSPEVCVHAQAAAGKFGEYSISVCRGPEAALPSRAEDYDAVILSGSKTRIFENAPWIEKELDFIRCLHEKQIPSLGICFGEQMMVRALTGSDWEEYTGASNISEYGWGKMELLENANLSSVFHSLPKEFYSYCMHSDEVYKTPKNFRATIKSADCPIQAFDILDAPMWGVQFHPERSLEEGNKSLDAKKQKEPGVRILGREMAANVFTVKIAQEIFTNFMKELWRSKGAA